MFIRQLFREERTLPRTDLAGIISFVLAISKEQLLMAPDREIAEDQRRRVEALVAERRQGKPLSYITHSREFLSRSFYVDERVLIPRPETELLVEEALKIAADRDCPARILDMGTGSGVIGLILAQEGARSVLCVDISPGAIEVAKKNAGLLGVERRVVFAVSDLFSALKAQEPFQIICANLPYVTSDEYNVLMPDVLDYEPRGALEGGSDGLVVYRRFVREALSYLAPGGTIICEIGGEEQAELLMSLFSEVALEGVVMKDLAGRQRVVKGTWTSLS